MSDTTGLLDAVAEVATHAGRAALERFRSTLAVEWKADGSPVTHADRHAEALAREWIAQRFPADGVQGEELSPRNPAARRQWIIDPIDGTQSFIRGVPLWGTLVAVAEGESVLAGCVYLPAVDELVCAAPGQGCWWNGARAAVSTCDELRDATVLTSDERFTHAPDRRRGWEKLASRARLSRTWGDCYGYVLVATGRADVMVDPRMEPWDAAALQPVIVEAGGVFTDWDGRATAFGGSAVATNAALATEVRRILGEARP
jgi:histidinol-phosphatase